MWEETLLALATLSALGSLAPPALGAPGEALLCSRQEVQAAEEDYKQCQVNLKKNPKLEKGDDFFQTGESGFF